LITAYCNHFYIAFQRINRKTDRPEHNVYLTAREQEVLTWAAVGKTDGEIGTILTLSEDTVDSYFRQIFRKLASNTRVMAVSKAISYGLIRP
jgi:DNA-binding CsgD family transcriptional regulator